MQQFEVKVEYQYTEPEYIAANRLIVFHSRDMIARLIVLGLLPAVWSIFLGFNLTHWLNWVPILVFVLLFEAALFYNVLVTSPRKHFRGDAKFRDRLHLTFSEEGIHGKSSQIDSKMAWSLYTKVLEGRDMYVLLYGKDTRMMTAVPKRAFSSNEQEQLFRELVSQHITDHSSLKQVPPTESDYKPKSLTPPDWR
jgi:hypothetical protein